MDKKKKKKLKKRMLNIFILICFAAGAFLLYQSIVTKIDENRSHETYSEIEDLYSPEEITEIPQETESPVPTETPVVTDEPTQTPEATMEPTPIPTITPAPEPTPNVSYPQLETLDRADPVLKSFWPLLDESEDIRGYIKMEDSYIVYPVVQGTDNVFYLERNIYGEKTISASIFLDYRNNVEVLDDNTIVYGHNMNKGMFNDLDYFIDEETREEFYEKNGIFRFDTVYKYMQWEVFSAYVINIEKDKFNYLATNFYSDSQHQDFINELMKRSILDYGIEVTTEDNILTLSTCNHWFNNSRTVIHARLITP